MTENAILSGNIGKTMLEIVSAESSEDIAAAKSLIRDYVTSIGVDPSFQNFDGEMENFPGMYCALLLAKEREQYVGVVALKKLSDGICEMKRMYCHPAYRGRGIGRALSDALIKTASAQGFTKMRLDTVLAAKESLALYRKLGFQEIAPYYDNPLDDVIYMELSLES